MWWVVPRVSMAVWASSGMALSIFRVMRVVEGALGMVEREMDVGCWGSRTAAMTVCEGLER